MAFPSSRIYGGSLLNTIQFSLIQSTLFCSFFEEPSLSLLAHINPLLQPQTDMVAIPEQIQSKCFLDSVVHGLPYP